MTRAAERVRRSLVGRPPRARAQPGRPRAHAVLALQRTAGNAAVKALVRRQTPAAAPSALPSPAEEAVEYLHRLAEFVSTQVATFSLLLGDERRPAAPPEQRRRAHAALDQARVARYLETASSTYAAQLATLPENDPLRVRLRDAYVEALGAVRRGADFALRLAESLGPVADPERAAYTSNLAAWIEAAPMTSAGLVGTTAFQQADVTAAGRWERELEAYLDDLLARLPGLALSAADRDRIGERIGVALRRAFVTVRQRPDGTIDVASIADERIADKYRRAVALLQEGMQARPQLTIITDRPPPIQLPDPVPDVTSQFAAARNTLGRIDLAHVPPDEVASVRFALLVLANTIFDPGSTVALRNAVWPLTLPVRRVGNVVSVRYEFVFDDASNVRAERLGAAEPRAIDTGFAQLSNQEKRDALVREFGLAAVDDRPAARRRAAAAWSDAELDQVKGAFDRLPPDERARLRGWTLVRDHRAPGAGAGGRTVGGFTHTGADRAHDEPGPPAHGPPHIHYYDEAFGVDAVTAVGAPGDTGPGGDWVLMHEVGHVQLFAATVAANARIAAADRRLRAAVAASNAAGRAVRWTRPLLTPVQAWQRAEQRSGDANVAFNRAVTSASAAEQARREDRLADARAAAATREERRGAMADAGVAQGVVDAAAEVGAALDEQLAASEALMASQQQVQVFAALARRFGFRPPTEYAATSDDELFPETYSLFLNDPGRLSAMNRNIFLWFQAGMPMDAGWNP